MRSSLSKNCRPLSEETPMNKNTPNRTGIGIKAKTGVISVDRPIHTEIKTAVTRCSRMPKNKRQIHTYSSTTA